MTGEVGFKIFEAIISQGFMSIIGDPLVFGLLIIGFFGAFVMLQGQRLDGMVLVLVPAFILSAMFLPTWVLALFGIACAILLYTAIQKKALA